MSGGSRSAGNGKVTGASEALRSGRLASHQRHPHYSNLCECRNCRRQRARKRKKATP